MAAGNRMERAYALFGENIKYLEGAKTKRMHVYVDEASNEKIRESCEKYGISISEYVIYTALSFDLSNVLESINKALNKTNELAKQRKIDVNDIEGKGEKEMGRVSTTGQTNKTESSQLNLRITPEAFEEIKRRATALSMSISDYIVFTTTHFDIMDIAKKVDEINSKLDKIVESENSN